MQKAFSEMDLIRYEVEGRPRLVHAKAGDMILWDSRTIHCNEPGSGKVVEDFLRVGAYVTMAPRKGVEKNVIEQRKAAWKTHTGTNHYPTLFHPREAMKSVPRKIDLTKEIRNLIEGTSF